MAVPPVARISDTPGWRISAAVVARVGRRGTLWTRSADAPCRRRTRWSRSTVVAPTFAAARWQLTMSAFRAFTQIKVLNTSVETGLVIGMSPSTTPIGSAISVSASRSLLPTTPTPGFPTSDCATSRLANRFLSALSVTEPMPVSATVAAASSSAWSAISVARAVIRPSTSSSGQPAMLCWAAADRATSASMAGSGSPVRMNSSRSFEKARAFVAALRASQRSINTPVGGSRSHNSPSAPADRRRATTSVCA